MRSCGLDEVFGQRLFKALLWDEFPQAQIEQMLEASRVIRFTRFGSRSVLASLNDIRYHVGLQVKNEGGLVNTDLAGLHHRLNRIPFGAIDYAYPVERLRDYLGQAADVV